MSIKEVHPVPGMDGTGPMGAGARTGRGRGSCAGGAAGRGLGMGCGRGFGFHAPGARSDGTIRKDVLEERKAELERMLADVDRRIGQL